MASILDASLSSDSEDMDYVPPSGKNVDCSSSDEDSVDELDENSPNKNKSRRKLDEKSFHKSKKPRVEASPEKVTDPVAKKQKIDDLWKSFKADVAELESKNRPLSVSEAPKIAEALTKEQVETGEKSQTSESRKDEKTVQPVFEFAGETFTVKDSKISETPVSNLQPPTEVKKLPVDTPSSTSKKQGGLSSLLGSLNKKKKLTVLEKTQLDWKSFTEENELDEELKHHRIGKDGFIERQRFLERSDLRSFDIEKNLRQLTRNKK